MIKHSELIDIFNAAIAAVDPCRAVIHAVRLEQNTLHIGDASYDLDKYKRIVVVGAGKATARMAMAIECLLGERISAGLIIVKDGHKVASNTDFLLGSNPLRLPLDRGRENLAPPLSRGGWEGFEFGGQSGLKIIQQIEAAHPVPNQAGMDGTQKILQLAQLADEETLFICLLSGGASALLVAPVAGVTLADKQDATSLLQKAGANIVELNTVRKHLSDVKGGRLAQAAFPAQMVTLILSDVIGDPLDAIASGPMVEDGSTFAEAWAVIEKFQLQKKISPSVSHYLQQGMAGKVSETVKQGDACLHKVRNVIVGNIMLALEAAKMKAKQLGIQTEIILTELQGEAREAARFLAQASRAALGKMPSQERRCLLSGGETTVTVTGSGLGGRNQELALAFALEIEGLQGVSLLSAGTDGSDGPNDAAGALVTGSTIARARQLGIDPVRYLADNDSYHFFQKFDAESGEQTHLLTGPTGTNVMDMQIILLEKY